MPPQLQKGDGEEEGGVEGEDEGEGEGEDQLELVRNERNLRRGNEGQEATWGGQVDKRRW